MSSIINFIRIIWNAFTGFYESLITVFRMVNLSMGFIEFFTAFLPTVISAGVIIFLAVYVIRFLLLK